MTLPPLFCGPPPDREGFIEQHAVEFSPEHWLSRLPDRRVFDPLADLAFAQQDLRWPQVTRRFVLDLARDMTTDEEAVQFYVAACAWGAGKRARLVGRRVRVLRENQDVGKRLLAALELARNDSLYAAYGSFQRGGENRLLHLGPGFFTKILYFGCWESEMGYPPLILDQYVAKALNDVAGLGWSTRWN